MLITYMIEVPQEHIMELVDFTAARNIHFNHHADIASSHPGTRRDAVLMGGDAAELREEINRHLEQRRIEPPVPGPVASWNVPRIQHFLDMAACNFSWSEGRIISSMDAGTWETIVRDTPEVFRQERE